MPFHFLHKAVLGKRQLKEVLKEAQTLFQAYVWDTANYTDGSVTPAKLSTGQYGGAYVLLVDSKSTGAGGGSSIAGTQTRDLNLEVTDTGNHCSLNTGTGEFTLDAGTWQIEAFSSAFKTNRHKLFLYNVSDTQNEPDIYSTSEYASNSNSVANKAFLAGEFTITGSKTFRIDHYTQTVQASQGLGVETSDGTAEIYTAVELRKVK